MLADGIKVEKRIVKTEYKNRTAVLIVRLKAAIY
jgi:hypothetical protein